MLVGGEDAGRDAQLGAHVRAGRAGRARAASRRPRRSTPPRSRRCPGRQDAQQPQDDVLGRHPRAQPAAQLHADHARAGEVERPAAHGHGHVQPAGPDGEHAHAAGGGRVAVAAQQRPARAGEPLQVDLVADAVARPRMIHADLGRDGLEVQVVVVVLRPELGHVVVDVADGQLGLDPRDAHRLEQQEGRRAGGVLGEGLVDADADLAAGDELAGSTRCLASILCVSVWGMVSPTVDASVEVSKRRPGPSRTVAMKKARGCLARGPWTYVDQWRYRITQSLSRGSPWTANGRPPRPERGNAA